MGRRWWSIPSRLGPALVLGAATTVAVAWGLSRSEVNPRHFARAVRQRTAAENGGTLELTTWREPGRTRWASTISIARTLSPTTDLEPERFAPRDVRPLLFTGNANVRPSAFSGTMAHVYTFGWPFRAVACTADSEWRHVLEVPLASSGPLIPPGLPVYLLPTGFALDVVVMAAPWSLVVFGPPAARRACRRYLGRCPTCGYDLRGLARGTLCPECGVPASSASLPSPRP